METRIKTINKEELQRLMKENQQTRDDNYSLSFFDIINRPHDENMISLMLNYLLINDKDVLRIILSDTYGQEINDIVIERIENEYVINNNKRIDILIMAKINKHESIIVIENKVYSGEHGNQCKIYHDYIEKAFIKKKRYYLFFKPDYNFSIPNCDEFKVVTYKKILDSITNEEDIYIQDFKKAILNNLVGRNMDELENYMLNNFKELYQKIISLDKMVNNFLENEFGKQLQNYLGCDKIEYYSKDYSVRFYDNKGWSGWRDNKNDNYYFYIEFVAHDKNISGGSFQRIIKRYSKDNDTKISRFCRENYPDKKDSDYYYVVDKKEFLTDKLIFSQEWKEELVNQAKKILKEMYEKQVIDVRDYLQS